MKFFLILVLLFSATGVFAGAKDDFIDAVKVQCKKTDDEAVKLATPGRSGNVMRFKTCSSASITVGDCTLQCKDKSSSIGG